MGPINAVGSRQLVSGWMGVETAKNTNSIIPKWLETTFCTDTPSTTTTINDTHLLVWRLFGQRNIGQTESSAVENSNTRLLLISCCQGILSSSSFSCYLLLRLLVYMYLSQLMRTFTNYLKYIVISS